MIDTLTITGTPDQGRHRLEESGDLDTAILLSPSYHLAQEEIAANYPAMADAFAACAHGRRPPCARGLGVSAPG